MTEVSTTAERNWAPYITEELEAIGMTVVEMPEHLTGEQAEKMLMEMMRVFEAKAAEQRAAASA